MGQKRQGGSTIGYVLIGAVLIAGLVGGVYALRQATAQKPAEIATQPSENKNETQKTQPEEQKPQAESNEKSSTDTSESTARATKPESSSTAPRVEDTRPTSSTDKQVELPQTGTSGVETWLVFGLISGAGIAYVRSRRFTLT